MKRLTILIAMCPVLAVLIAAANPQYTIPMHTAAPLVTGCSGPLPFTDNFGGTGPLSPCWKNTTVTGYVACQQNGGYASSSGGASSACQEIVGGSFAFSSTNQYAQGAVDRRAGTVDEVGLVVNGTSSGSGVIAIEYGGTFYVQQLNNGAYVRNLCTASGVGAVTIKLAVSGTTYTATNVTNSTTICSGTQTGMSGSPGMIATVDASGNVARVSNFTAD
jgi:hypothetical protein